MRAVSETEKNIPGLLSHILQLENFAVRASLNKCYVQGCAAIDGAAAAMGRWRSGHISQQRLKM